MHTITSNPRKNWHHIMVIPKLFPTLLLLILLFPCTGQSVEIESLRWKVSGFHNSQNNDDVTQASIFETSPNLIRWLQKNGSMVYDFSITGKSGSWDDVKEAGEITYSVTFRNAEGTIRFKRGLDGVTIETNIREEGKNILPYAFFVSNVTSN